MVKYKLNIYINSDNNIIDKALESVDYPSGMSGEVFYSSHILTDLVEGFPSVVLTDRPETASLLTMEKPENCYVVFFGEFGQAERFASELYDLWIVNSFTPVKEVKKRCEWLFERIRHQLDAAFYRDALRATVDTVPEMLWVRKNDGSYADVNDTFLKNVHRAKKEVIGKRPKEVWKKRTYKEDTQLDFPSSSDPGLTIGTVYISGEDNDSLRQLTTYKRTISDALGNDIGVLSICGDAANSDNLGLELSTIIDNMPYPMIIFTPNWKVIKMNSLFKEIIGIEEINIFDYNSWKKNSIEPSGDRTKDERRNIITQEFKIVVNCEVAYYSITEFAIKDRFGILSGYVCTAIDNTYQHTYQKSITEAANTDSLTCMHNRRFFYNYLGTNIKKPLYLMYIDLDNFKAVNDNYGYDVGDAMLVRMSQLINRFFSDSVTARIGADEFAVINDKSTKDELRQRCELLEQTVSREFRMYECDIGASIVIVHSEGDADNADMIIHESDVKMAEVKKAHRSEADK